MKKIKKLDKNMKIGLAVTAIVVALLVVSLVGNNQRVYAGESYDDSSVVLRIVGMLASILDKITPEVEYDEVEGFTFAGITNYDSLTLGEDLVVGKSSTFTGASTLTGTSTITKSFDGHIAWSDFTTATGTDVALYQNTTGTSMMCDGYSGFAKFETSAFAPALDFSLSTSTTATGDCDGNLIASTTIATTSADTILPFSPTTPFILANGSYLRACSQANSKNASSTHLSRWDGEIGVHCWLTGE